MLLAASRGRDDAQGFYVSEALPAEEFVDFCRDYSALLT